MKKLPLKTQVNKIISPTITPPKEIPEELKKRLDKIKNQLKKIKRKYHFKDDHNLLKDLETLPLSVHLGFGGFEEYLPRVKIKALLNKIIPSKLRDFLITDSGLYKTLDGIVDIAKRQFNINITGLNPNWSIYQFKIDLGIFFRVCDWALNFLQQRDKGGQKPFSISKDVIKKLAWFYQVGTGKSPTGGWEDIKGIHVGEFYEFVLELKPILKKFGINLGKNKTIGTYVVEKLKEFREEKDYFEQLEKISFDSENCSEDTINL